MAYALGLVQMAVFTSQTVGPVVGGVLAQAFGFRPTFALGGTLGGTLGGRTDEHHGGSHGGALPDLQPYVDRMAAFRTPRWLVGEIDLFNVVDDPLKRYERIGRWALTGR